MYPFKKVNKINWYKQSGAGIPLCVSMPGSAFPNLYNKIGLYFPNDIVFSMKNENGFIFNHYFDYELTRREVKKIFSILEKDNSFFKKLKKEFYFTGENTERIGLKMINESIESKEFARDYKKFLDYSISFWSDSLFIDLLDPFEEEILNFIFQEKRRIISKEDINVLIGSDQMSLFQQSQLAMLKIYEIAIKKGINSREVVKMLEKQSDKYYWQKNDYEKVEYLDVKYFKKQLQYLIKNKKEVEQIRKNLMVFKKQFQTKRQIVKKYGLNKRSTKYLDFFNWVTSYREDRKKYNQIGNYVLIKIIENISKEKNINIEFLKCLIPSEILEVIKNPNNIVKELKERLKYGIIFFGYKNKDNEMVSGKIAIDYLKLLEKKIIKMEIKGNTASVGKVIGNVKIILNQKDFLKMKDGDVLVTSMTRPEFIPIMKKASAIITDEGGITCHAAIVSREFGIPCITGTQNATKLLKDGYLVDVNANHGLVKIIKN